MITLDKNLTWQGSGEKWQAGDICCFTGHELIETTDGRVVCEVLNEEDISIIKNAPEMLKLLRDAYESIESAATLLGSFGANSPEVRKKLLDTHVGLLQTGADIECLLKEICDDSKKD